MNIRLTEQMLRTVAEQTVFHRRSATNRTFRSFFGCNSGVATFLWNRARRQRLLPGDFTPKHMLWTLAFIKLYETEAVLSGICGCDEKTFRKWVWKGIDVLFDLDLVRPLLDLLLVSRTLIHLSAFSSFTTDRLGESIHARERQCLPCNGWCNGLQNQQTNTLQRQVVFVHDRPCRP